MKEATCFCTIDVLKFDNSYCWTHSKEVFHSVKVILPDENRVTLPKQHDLVDHVTECLATACSNEAACLQGVTVAPEEQEDSSSLYYTPSQGSGSLSPADSREDIDD